MTKKTIRFLASSARSRAIPAFLSALISKTQNNPHTTKLINKHIHTNAIKSLYNPQLSAIWNNSILRQQIELRLFSSSKDLYQILYTEYNATEKTRAEGSKSET